MISYGYCQVRIQLLACGLLDFDATRKVKKGPLTLVPKVVRNGPGHSSTKNSMVPVVVSNGPNTYPHIDAYPLIYRPVDLSRSISTVDDDSPTEEYCPYRRSIQIHLRRITVDR